MLRRKEQYYETDGEGEYLPGPLRYNRVGAQNYCQHMENIRKAAGETSDVVPT